MLILERLEADARADMIAAMVLAAAGGKVEVVTVEERRQAFNAALNAEEKHVSQEQRDLMDALGVGR